MGCHSLIQGIFPTQGSNLGLLHCRQVLYHLSQQESQWALIQGVQRTRPNDRLDMAREGKKVMGKTSGLELEHLGGR